MKAIKSFYHVLVDNKISTLSGALCFFIILNGGFYIFLFSNIASMLIDVHPLINSLLEDGIIKNILMYLLNYNSNLNVSIILIISSIYSSSSLYYHFLQATELICKMPHNKSIGKRIYSIILVPVVLLFIFVISICLLIIHDVNRILFYLFIIACYYLLLLFLNILVFKNKNIIKGITFSFLFGVFFTILFVLYNYFFSDFKIVYGILSFVIIFLFYIYIMIIGILMGIYINCKNLEVFSFSSIS